jgi:RNA polymerase sporulation-specific sigma factor
MQTHNESFPDLIERAQSGDTEAERQLLEDNLPLVTAIAKRYLNSGVEPDDLRQLGSIGLLKAIRKFDPSFNVCFSTYAVPLIAGEIRRFLRDDGIIKFSRSAKSLAQRIRRELETEPDLTIETLSERLGVSREDLAAAYASDSPVGSLDEPLPNGSGNRFDQIGVDSEEELTVKKMSLQAALQTLSPRERLLVRLRYREEKSQSEAGRILGVSQVQVSRLEKKILSALRSRMMD